MSINLQSCMLSIRWWQKKHPGIQKTFIIIYIFRGKIEKKSCLYGILLPFYSSVVLSTFILIFPGGFRSYRILFLANLPIHTQICRRKKWTKKKKHSAQKKNIIFYYSDPTNVEKIIMLSLSHTIFLYGFPNFIDCITFDDILMEWVIVSNVFFFLSIFFLLVVFDVLLCYSSVFRIIFFATLSLGKKTRF